MTKGEAFKAHAMLHDAGLNNVGLYTPRMQRPRPPFQLEEDWDTPGCIVSVQIDGLYKEIRDPAQVTPLIERLKNVLAEHPAT